MKIYYFHVDKDGNRAEGTKADSQIWEMVRAGNDYKTDGVEIQGEEYYVYYMPVCSDDGEILEWLLPENGRA